MQWRWLAILSWPEFRQHPWRTLTAVLAIALGVALAHAVHLINTSALAEFSQAVRTAQAQADWVVQSRQGPIPEHALIALAQHPDVAVLSPVLDTRAELQGRDGQWHPLRVLGVDALSMAEISPDLLPQSRLPVRDGATSTQDTPTTEADPSSGSWQDWFAPDAIFLNASAQQLLGMAGHHGFRAESRTGMASTTDAAKAQSNASRTSASPAASAPEQRMRVAGHVSAAGAPLVVMDVAAAQLALGQVGQISRIDLKLHRAVPMAQAHQHLQLPDTLWLSRPDDATARTAHMSQAYRVNLSVLALVALFTGAFLVYSVLALSVSQRAPQLALLGVMGWSPAERQGLIWRESLLLGALGSALGLGLGLGLAWGAMQVLGGDLGGGHFSSHTPSLSLSWPAMLGHGLLGMLAALFGGALPARAAAKLPPAQTLKGVGQSDSAPLPWWVGAGLMLLALGLALLPPWRGIPIAAYLAVAALLLGGMAWLPNWVSGLSRGLAARGQHHALALLAIERAHRQRSLAAVAVSGVVAALALATALTVMVSSFRNSMLVWLDDMLPATVYVRMPGDAPSDLPDATRTVLQHVAGVSHVRPQRIERWPLDPQQAALWLMWRPLQVSASDATPNLPFTESQTAPDPASGRLPVYISEPVRDRLGLQLGQEWPELGRFLQQADDPRPRRWVVSGIYRDYARAAGSVTLDWDTLPANRASKPTELALWLAPHADTEAVLAQARRQLQAMGQQLGLDAPPQLHSTTALRDRAMQLFDRSFAVTQWLQLIAIGIGLFGVSASFSAQALARRKEFGLLVHLGLTQAQVQRLVALEGFAWCSLGALAGGLLGLGVSLILVKVVNPQSFHWSMDLHVPVLPLMGLGAGVVLAGTLTAWLTARRIGTQDAVQAVKEDW